VTALDLKLAPAAYNLQHAAGKPCELTNTTGAQTSPHCRRQVVRLYDAQALQHLQQLLPPASSSSSASSAGFSDCQFTRSAPYTLAAAGYSGQVHLWDQRASNTARLALSAARGSGICSLQVSADGHYIYGAASTGHQVRPWGGAAAGLQQPLQEALEALMTAHSCRALQPLVTSQHCCA
jgi:hypothetical protein